MAQPSVKQALKLIVHVTDGYASTTFALKLW
jgi:hypothetical protein